MMFSGDNFGVQIQEEVLNEIHRSQESAYNLRDAARQHSLQRAKICSKVVKYPHVEDWTVRCFLFPSLWSPTTLTFRCA